MQRSASLAVMVGLLVGAAGCGSSRGDTERHLKRLQDELTRVQNTADRLEERVAALELRSEPAAEPRATQDATQAPVYRPRLKVIHMVPGEEQPAGDAK